MKVTVIVLFLAAQLLCGNCRPQATFSDLHPHEPLQVLMTGSVNKRQAIFGTCTADEVRQIFANYPQDCLSEFGRLDVSAILNQDSSAIIAAYRIVCQPRCGNPAISLYNQCGVSVYSSILRSFCSRNDAGGLCYEDFGTLIPDYTRVSANCIPHVSTCTSSCQSSLITFGSNHGCCLNIFNNTVFNSNSVIFPVLENDLWSDCGVNTPGFCDLQTSSLSAAEGAYLVKVLYLLTLVVTAMLLF